MDSHITGDDKKCLGYRMTSLQLALMLNTKLTHTFAQTKPLITEPSFPGRVTSGIVLRFIRKFWPLDYFTGGA